MEIILEQLIGPKSKDKCPLQETYRGETQGKEKKAMKR